MLTDVHLVVVGEDRMSAADPVPREGGPTVRVGAASHRGGRLDNEDSYRAGDGVYLVADGMGGHEAGEVASATAVESLGSLTGGTPDEDDVRAALRTAHERVRALPLGGERRPGTTVSGVVLSERDGLPCWLVLNVGDSRTYRMVGGVLEQLTTDHSRVAELVATGFLDPQDVSRHPERHVVTRVLGGGSPDVEPDVFALPVSPTERIVVCSDGLSEALPDARIQAELRAHPAAQQAADALVAAALAVGARDNVTVVVVDVVG